MLLVFDVGNSETLIGVFEKEKLLTSWRIDTDVRKSADEYGMLINQLFAYEGIDRRRTEALMISTVVPSLLFTLQHMAVKYFGKRALVVEAGIKTGLAIKYDDPRQVGSDQIVNAVAAYHKYGGPLIIIDFGTATSFCAVTEKGQFLGGTIAPGMKIASEALFERTSKLPRVEIEAPGRTIGKNTAESMQSGLVYSQVGACEYIVRRMKEELQEASGSQEVKVVATGGMARLIAQETDCIDHVDKMLTLEGLRIIYEKNR